jgi:hypothetical protein
MTDKALPTDAHCIGCQGWTEPEYLRREKCPGLNLDAARVAAPSDGLREWLADPLRDYLDDRDRAYLAALAATEQPETGG